MPVVRETSRIAHVPAAGSTVRTIDRRKYTTIWDYREGYIATTDPDVARLIGVGTVGIGLAALLLAVSCSSPRGRAYASERWG